MYAVLHPSDTKTTSNSRKLWDFKSLRISITLLILLYVIIIMEIWGNNKRNLERMQTTNDEIINYIINLGYKLIKQLGDNYIFLPQDKTLKLL